MKKRNVVAVFLCGAVLSVGISVFNYMNRPQEIYVSGIIPDKSEEELILDSDLIIEGIVTDIGEGKQSNPNKEPGKRNIIQSDVTVEIKNVLSGEYDKDFVTVRVDEGYDKESNAIMISEGEADFEENEQVLLFLSRDDGDLATDEDYFVLTGMIFGKYTLNESKTLDTYDMNGSYTNIYSSLKKEDVSIDEMRERILEEKKEHPDWDEEREIERENTRINNAELFGE